MSFIIHQIIINSKSISPYRANILKHLIVIIRGYELRNIATIIFIFFCHVSYGQHVEILKSDDLFQMIEDNDKNLNIKVYNFWATWCAPCIREIPQFEKINASYGNVDVILICLDDVDLLNKKVKPFINIKEIKSTVVLLDETDFNEIIERVDKSWSGAIPATLIVDHKNQKQIFFEGEFKEGELEKTIEKVINQL